MVTKMNDKIKILFKIIIVLTLIIPFIVMIFISVDNDSFFNDDFDDEVNVEWFYVENDQIKKINFPVDLGTKTNEESSIFTILPNNCKKIDTLFIRSLYQSVEVSIDDIVIYVYDTEDTRLFGLSNPRKLNIVKLPQNIEGKKLTITTKCPYPKYSGYYSEISLGENNNIVNKIYEKYSFGFILSLLIILFSLCLIFVNILFVRKKMTISNIVYLLISGLFLGLWQLGDSKLISIYLNSFVVNQLMYVSFMGFMLMFSIYCYLTSGMKIKNIFKIFLIITTVNLIVQCLLYINNVSDYVILFPFNLVIVLFLLSMYFIRNIVYIHRKKQKNGLRLVDYLENVVFIFFILCMFLNMTLRQLTNMNINIVIGTLFIIYIIIIYVKGIVDIVVSAEKSEIYKLQLKETKNYLIQSQMKPHFIFNTLSAIRTLIISKPDAAYNMTTNFSKYLRANIDDIEPGSQIPFSKELEHIKAYVSIEKERFQKRLNVVFDIETTSFTIPPLSIEPLVENAVKHGVCKKIEGGTVRISSKEYEDRYVVIVEDDGVGFDIEILESEEKVKSVGLKYIILRLKELSNADFEIDSKVGSGTKAKVTIYK